MKPPRRRVVYLLLCALALVIPVAAQSAKQTIKQCREFVAAVVQEPYQTTDSKTYTVLNTRLEAISACEKAESIRSDRVSNETTLVYLFAETQTEMAMLKKLESFLTRHDLGQRFLDEDEEQ